MADISIIPTMPAILAKLDEAIALVRAKQASPALDMAIEMMESVRADLLSRGKSPPSS